MIRLTNTIHLLLLILFVGIRVNASVIYVDASKASGSNNGSSWTDAFISFQSALDVALSSDQIWVAAGTYYPSKESGGSGTKYRTFELKSGISVYGGFAGTEASLTQRNYSLNITKFCGDIGITITDWNNFSAAGWNDNVLHVFYANSNGTLWSMPAKIDGCVIAGGYANIDVLLITKLGGGILVYKGGYVELANNRFEYNYASACGGAISNYENSKVIIDNCVITKNCGLGEVGGVWNERNSTAEVYNSEISYNTGKFISGMLNLGNSSCVVSNCIFFNNSSEYYGTFCNHSASNAVLNNCLFYNNSNTADFGGAVSNILSNLTANNLTIVDNTGSNGGGLYNTGTSTINNSIMWGNTSTNGKQIYNSSGSTTLNYSCYSNGTGDVYGSITATNNNITIDPLFVDVAADDFRIYKVSPCTDAGNNSYNSEIYDIRSTGFDRKLDKTNGNVGTIDMGAYEYKFGTDPYCFGINPANGGIIATDQSICLGDSPVAITNSTLPSGHFGTLEYKWQQSTTSGSIGFSDIIGANNDFYLPGIPTTTTWYKRISRVDCKHNWLGASESNVIKITVNPIYAFNENHSICGGETYSWQGVDRTTAGTYSASYKSINGCDSIYTLNLAVNPVYAFTENQSICDGETFSWRGADYTTAGTFNANYKSVNGCDSIYTLNLTVNPVYAFTENQSICDGETYSWQGIDYTTSGTYTANYTSIAGCDSIYTLNLTVNPLPASAGTITGATTVCQGQNSVTYTVPAITNATSYTWNLPSGATGTSITNSIDADFETTATSGDITVKGNNPCGDGPASTLAITVNHKPATPVISLTGNVLQSDAQTGNQWYDRNGLIGGATSKEYTVTVNGDYYSIVTLLGCSSDPSNTISVVVSSVEVVDENPIFKVYPVPVSDELIIENEGKKEMRYFEIINSIGIIVFKGNFIEKTAVPTSNFSPGVYIVKVETRNKFVYKKIVKE